MRTIVHLSDLHFGRIESGVLEPLAAAIKAVRPDVVVVSGDLTQRARSDQFRAAKQYLDALPAPKVVVPGNHDVPLYNPITRFLTPLRKYKRYISRDLQPSYLDDELAVVGVSSARSLVVKNGRINGNQIAGIRRTLGGHDAENRIRVVVTHHPFDLDDEARTKDLIGRAPEAMRAFREIGVDLLLAGHIHHSRAGVTATRYRLGDYSAVAVQAGTATSTRRRREENAFNVIRTEADNIQVTAYAWNTAGREFRTHSTVSFAKTSHGWVQV